MKTKAITLLIILASFQAIGGTVSTSVDTCASTKAPIGYFILTYDKENGYRPTTTIELVDVYTIAETVAPGNCINFNQKLKESVMFEFCDGSKSFRVEVRKINHKGKFRPLNRKEIKKYLSK